MIDIQQGDHVGQPLRRLQSWDGRTVELWSLDPLDVKVFQLDFAGPFPAEPVWVSGGTFTVTTGGQAGASNARTGSTQGTSISTMDTQSGDGENELLKYIWEKRIAHWQTEFDFAQKLADAISQKGTS